MGLVEVVPVTIDVVMVVPVTIDVVPVVTVTVPVVWLVVAVVLVVEVALAAGSGEPVSRVQPAPGFVQSYSVYVLPLQR